MALTEQEVQALINDVIAKSKEFYKAQSVAGKGVQAQWTGLPDYYPSYRKAVNQMRRIAPHADVDVFPEMLFKHRAPNQSEEEANYLRNTYRCTTHPVFVDYVSSVSNVTNEGNWSWEFAEEDGDNTLIEYVDNGVPVYGSVKTFLKTMLPSLMAKDANGVIAIRPREIKTVEVNGEQVVDDTAFNEPIPIYYNSEQVVGFKHEKYAVIEVAAKSPVTYGLKTYNIGRIFEVYDDTNIWRITQVGSFIENTFEYELFFSHNSDVVPVERLKGIPKVEDDGEVYWTSQFYYAVDLLDRALAKENNVEVSTTRVVFPTAIIQADECDLKTDDGSCHGGSWMDSDGNINGTCKSCNGTGFKMNLSPFKNYYQKKRSGVDAGSDSSVPLSFVSPDTAGLEFVRDSAKEDKAEARSMLHLRTSSSAVQPSDDTAIGGILDQKAYFRFIQLVSDHTFDTLEWILDRFNDQRYGGEKERPSINRPKSFDFKTTEDYLNDIKAAREAGLPDAVINILVFKFFRSMHFGESQTARAIDLMAKADRLLTVSSDELSVKVAQNLVEPWEVVLHDSAFSIVTALMMENPDIFELDLMDQIKLVEGKAKELTREVDPSTNTILKTLIPRQTG